MVQGEVSRNTARSGSMQMQRLGAIVLTIAFMTGGMSAVLADSATRASTRSEDSVKALALQWFTQMASGQIDRTQLASGYSAQLTDDAVQAMSHQLKQYGASPTSAQMLRSRATDDQAFYLVKLVFPRGDAAAMLVGFDMQGKITGIDFVSMAGD
jgi:hypothetical protein